MDAIRGCKELEVFNHRHVVVDTEKVGHESDEFADLLGMRVDGMATDIGFSIGGCQERCDDAHGCRFAGTVGTDEAEKVPFLQVQVDLSDRVHVAVFFGQVFSLDHRSNLSWRWPLHEATSRPHDCCTIC